MTDKERTHGFLDHVRTVTFTTTQVPPLYPWISLQYSHQMYVSVMGVGVSRLQMMIIGKPISDVPQIFRGVYTTKLVARLGNRRRTRRVLTDDVERT